MIKRVLIPGLIGVAVFSAYTAWNELGGVSALIKNPPGAQNTAAKMPTDLPSEKMIEGLSHSWQSFNNCSSVALMAALSHWGVSDTQEAIAEATRPWNNPNGDNDDKSVTLYELAAYASEKYGMTTYVRPNGTIDLLRAFIANDIPVVARTLMYPEDDIVHYRTVRGYDENAKTIVESDGVYGPDKVVSYQDWMHLWKNFNYSYLIVITPDKKALVERILGAESNEQTSWRGAKARAEDELAKNPSDPIAHFNLLTAAFYLGDYDGTVREFEKLESRLTRRVLWYQHEPIEAYFKLGRYDPVLELTEKIIGDNNRSVSELYYMRGAVFEIRADAAARTEYEKALYYNEHLRSAIDALASLP